MCSARFNFDGLSEFFRPFHGFVSTFLARVDCEGFALDRKKFLRGMSLGDRWTISNDLFCVVFFEAENLWRNLLCFLQVLEIGIGLVLKPTELPMRLCLSLYSLVG